MMNKKRFFLAFFFMVLVSCSAQKQSTMRNFDIETFNKNKENGEYEFINDDSVKVRLRENDNSYIEILKHKDSIFEQYNTYYKNGNLKITVKSFTNDFMIGILKKYDKNGNLTKEEDLDKPFTYSWEDVKKYLKEHDVEDIQKQVIDISRWSDEEETTWTLEFNGTYKDIKGRFVITLNGKTGEELEVKLFKGKDALGETGTIAVYDTIYKK